MYFRRCNTHSLSFADFPIELRLRFACYAQLMRLCVCVCLLQRYSLNSNRTYTSICAHARKKEQAISGRKKHVQFTPTLLNIEFNRIKYTHFHRTHYHSEKVSNLLLLTTKHTLFFPKRKNTIVSICVCVCVLCVTATLILVFYQNK